MVDRDYYEFFKNDMSKINVEFHDEEKLTREEVNYIVDSVIKDARCIMKDCSEYQVKQLRKEFKENISGLSIRKENIDYFIQHSKELFETAQIQALTPVGTDCVTSISAIISQMVLDLHKVAGSSGASKGIAYLRNITSASEKKKQPINILYFNEKEIPKNDNRMNRILPSKLKDKVDTIDSLTRYIYSELLETTCKDLIIQNSFKIRSIDELDTSKSWVKAQLNNINEHYNILNEENRIVNNYVEISFDPVLLVFHNCTLEEICKKIGSKASLYNCVAFMFSSIFEGTVYIIPLEANKLRPSISSRIELSDSQIQYKFCETIIKNTIDVCVIKGNESLLNVKINSNPITLICNDKSIRKIKDKWEISVSKSRARLYGFNKEKIKQFLYTCNLKFRNKRSLDTFRIDMKPITCRQLYFVDQEIKENISLKNSFVENSKTYFSELGKNELIKKKYKVWKCVDNIYCYYTLIINKKEEKEVRLSTNKYYRKHTAIACDDKYIFSIYCMRKGVYIEENLISKYEIMGPYSQDQILQFDHIKERISYIKRTISRLNENNNRLNTNIDLSKNSNIDLDSNTNRKLDVKVDLDQNTNMNLSKNSNTNRKLGENNNRLDTNIDLTKNRKLDVKVDLDSNINVNWFSLFIYPLDIITKNSSTNDLEKIDQIQEMFKNISTNSFKNNEDLINMNDNVYDFKINERKSMINALEYLRELFLISDENISSLERLKIDAHEFFKELEEDFIFVVDSIKSLVDKRKEIYERYLKTEKRISVMNMLKKVRQEIGELMNEDGSLNFSILYNLSKFIEWSCIISSDEESIYESYIKGEEESDLCKKSRVLYAVVSGKNKKGLMWNKFTNKDMSYTSDFDIKKKKNIIYGNSCKNGIFYLKNQIFHDIYSTFKEKDISISPKYIHMLSSYIVMYGKITPISSKSFLSKPGTNAIEGMVFRSPIQNLPKKTLYGSNDKLLGRYADKIYNKQSKLGTGGVDIVKKDVSQALKILEKKGYPQKSRILIQNAIEDLNKLSNRENSLKSEALLSMSTKESIIVGLIYSSKEDEIPRYLEEY